MTTVDDREHAANARPTAGRALAALAIAVSTVGAIAPTHPLTTHPVTTWSAPRVVAAESPPTARLVPIGPVRLADTRNGDCGCGHLDAATITIDVTGRDDVPDDAVAAAITVTALPTLEPGHVTVYPTDQPRPEVSTVNTRPDRVVANAAVVPLGADGTIALYRHSPGGLVVDLTAVFVPAATSRAGRFVPVAPVRLVDTRTPTPPSGPLSAGGMLRVPLPAGVDADATALVVNITSVDEPGPGHLSARPAGAEPGGTSVLNLDGSGRAVAATVIVPVDEQGFQIESFSGGEVIVDLAGWFTGPGAADDDRGLFVPFGPTRLVDTRREPPRLHPGGTIEVASPVEGAAALVTNVTVVRPDRMGHVTAYPARTPVPGTSSVNPTSWNHTVANLAITATSTIGVAYRAHAGTDLVVDMTGWFTGSPMPATMPKAPNDATRSRVLVIGDSTLAAVDLYPESYAAFVGYDAVVDAKSCRRLARPSCRSAVTGVIPNTAVEAIESTPGTVDVVVIKTGYNDAYEFAAGFDAVVRAARAKGAHTIVWQTYNDYRGFERVRLAIESNNRTLRSLVTQPRYADVVLADWQSYSGARSDWFWDGIHMTRAGSIAQADYISRWIAALEHRPCPRPWVVGAEPADPCPSPDAIGPVPDPASLY